MEAKNRFNAIKLLIPLFLVSIFILSINKIGDADAWIHLSMGRLIWNLKGLPANEPFAYPMSDAPFAYTSWLVGVAYYLAYLLFNAYGVILLKALIITTAFYILLKDSLMPYKNYAVAIIVMTVVAIFTRHRFVERPDIFLMVFLSFSIFSLNAYVCENKKYIYTLPFVHLLWANSHSSINLMVVPFLSFVVGGYIQLYLDKKGAGYSNTPSASQLKTVLLIFLASFAASLLNPNYFSQYTFGAQFLASGWYKKTIIELMPPTWDTFKSPYLITAALIVSFILNLVIFFYRSSCKRPVNPPSVIHLFLILPFIFLSFTAIRFVLPLAVVSGPIVARNISELVEWAWGKGQEKRGISGIRIYSAVAAVWILLYTSLTLAGIKPFGDWNQEFGFGFNHSLMPEGALRYMDKRNITGRVYNKFHFGQYIAWRDFPKRAPFIDGRGYLTPDLLKKMDDAKYNMGIFAELYNRYGFESVLVYDPLMDVNVSASMRGVDLAFSNPTWALVYLDDLSLLYLRRGGPYEAIIREDEYRFRNIDRTRLSDNKYASAAIRELKRNIEETGSSNAYFILGLIYNEMGYYREAIGSLSKVRDLHPPLPNHTFEAYKKMAYAFNQLGNFDESVRYCEMALSIREDAPLLYNMGIVYFKKGEKKKAADYLKRAIDMDKNLTDAYSLLIRIYNELGLKEEGWKLEKKMKEVLRSPDLLNP